MNTRRVTTELVIAYALCPRKADLLLRHDEPRHEPEYIEILHQRRLHNQRQHGVNPSNVPTQITPETLGEFLQSKEIVLHANVSVDDMEAICDILTVNRADDGTLFYTPTIITGTYKVYQDQILHAAFVGYVLGELLGIFPHTGKIVGLDGKAHAVVLSKQYRTIRHLIDMIRSRQETPTPEIARVALNEHCPYCPYQKFCTQLAEQNDDITLLDRVSPKIARQYHKKGIFTITQLSYLFRPRRHRKKISKTSIAHKPEIQALAIRTHKIYVHEQPNLRRSPIELFLDIEGIPDQDTYYLIGLLVSTERATEYFSFWADTIEDEKQIWLQLTSKLSDYPDAPIYHYGGYESSFLRKMMKRYSRGLSDIVDVSHRLVNINASIYGRVYFPVKSNRLKDIARFLGGVWTSVEASGIQSLVWRSLWEDQQDGMYKQYLTTYNREDCVALKLVLDELVRIADTAEDAIDIDFTDQPKQIATLSGTQIHNDFKHIMRSAHADYDYAKIHLRDEPGQNGSGPKKRGAKKGHPAHHRPIPKTRHIVYIPPRQECPRCLGVLLRPTTNIVETISIDITFSRKGCQKTVTKYTSFYGYCQRCHGYYEPAELSDMHRHQLFGHGFCSWIAYHRLALRLPYRVIAQALEDQFCETISPSTALNAVRRLAKYYTTTVENLRKHVLDSPFIHVDETKVNIQGVNHYVWVFTNGAYVFFEMTETREADIVHKILSGYTGILISDFYGGYDAAECMQQKCLVHLIRDMNEDLWKSPFDAEYESFVSQFRDLIKPILDTVRTHGSKQKYLAPFERDVDAFYNNVIEKAYFSEAALKYQKRFLRYRQSLFTFLKYDSIPWNNNMAERAIRHLAVQRKISGSFFDTISDDYLPLLAIMQTCRFQNKSFLQFLLSKEKNIDNFGGYNRKRDI